MSRTLNTLAAGALALALIVPAYAETPAPAPSSTPGVTQTKAPVGKTTLKKGKHGRKGTQSKQHSATSARPGTTSTRPSRKGTQSKQHSATAPAPSTAPAAH